MKAREVFRDCEYAKNRLYQAIAQNNLEDAKLFWFASLAMLRAIGHVLDKVDKKTRSVAFNDILLKRFNLWKQDPMFRDFIELERNNIVKEYRSSLTEKETLEDFSLTTEAGDKLVTETGDYLIVTMSITTLVKGNGIYSGTSPVEMLTKALNW